MGQHGPARDVSPQYHNVTLSPGGPPPPGRSGSFFLGSGLQMLRQHLYGIFLFTKQRLADIAKVATEDETNSAVENERSEINCVFLEQQREKLTPGD